MNETIQVLTKARRLLERGWCQGTFAINGQQKPVNPKSRSAKCFCLTAAILLAAGSGLKRLNYAHAMRAIQITLFGDVLSSGLAEWNDAPGRTQGEVLAVVDKTIARLKEAQA